MDTSNRNVYNALVSTGNALRFEFTSDAGTQHRGFQILYFHNDSCKLNKFLQNISYPAYIFVYKYILFCYFWCSAHWIRVCGFSCEPCKQHCDLRHLKMWERECGQWFRVCVFFKILFFFVIVCVGGGTFSNLYTPEKKTFSSFFAF